MSTTREAEQSTYTLPNDAPEASRLDTQHELFRLTFSGKLLFAPIPPQPATILDIGCGTSNWAIEVATLYPNSKVYGLDLGQPQPPNLPSNYTYLTGSFENPWPFEDAHFDFIHGRFINIAITDHKFVISEALRCLKPGGWFEMQEFSLPGSTSVEAVKSYWDEYTRIAAKMGRDLGAFLTWGTRLKKAGFENVHTQNFEWPIGPRKGEVDDKMIKIGNLMMENYLGGIRGFSVGFFTRGGGWTEEQVLEYLGPVVKAFEDNPGESVFPLHVIYGQKPA